jgi:hypothetical protein
VVDVPTIDDVGYGARAAAGSARTPEEMLATIRQSFPDAELSTTGTAVFTSPRTHRPMYFNAPGPDRGDLAAGARMVAEGVGGVAGGMMGAAGGPVGSVAGAAAGTAVAGQAVDYIRRALGLPQSYDPGDVGRNVVGDVVGGAAGEAGGQVLGRAVKAGAGAIVRPPELGKPGTDAAATVAHAENAGVPVTAAMVTRGLPSSAEQRASQVLPLSTSQRLTNELYDKAGNKIDQLRIEPPAGTPAPQNAAQAGEQAGGALKRAAADAYKKFETDRQALDDGFFRLMPRDARLDLPNVGAYAQGVQAKIAKAPKGTQAVALKPVADQIDQIVEDLKAGNGTMSLEDVRQLRTRLGAQLQSKATTELPSDVQQQMGDLRAALNEDLRGAAAQASPEARAALAKHDEFVTDFRHRERVDGETPAKALEAFTKADSNEAAWRAFSAGSVERLKRLSAAMTDDQRRVVARATFEHMATTGAGNTKSPATWATAWLKSPPELRKEMFGPYVDIGKLDSLAQVLRRHVEGVTWGNPSRSGYEIGRADLGASLAKLAGGLFGTGGPGTLAFGLTPTAIVEGAAIGGGYLALMPLTAAGRGRCASWFSSMRAPRRAKRFSMPWRTVQAKRSGKRP